MEDFLIDDVVACIVSYIIEPMRKHDTRPDACVYAYFSLCLTSKQFKRVIDAMLSEPLDWFMLGGKEFGKYGDWRCLREEVSVSLQSVRMAKTLTFYESGLPVIRKEIDLFMASNGLQYRTKGTGKPYKGYVGVRKLKTLKVTPISLDKRLKELCNRYEEMNKKRLLFSKEMDKYAAVVRHRTVRKVVPIDWASILCHTK